jgi:tetratricopeptide (TPR) repeat protein
MVLTLGRCDFHFFVSNFVRKVSRFSPIRTIVCEGDALHPVANSREEGRLLTGFRKVRLIVAAVSGFCLSTGAALGQGKEKVDAKVRSSEFVLQANELMQQGKHADALKIIDQALKADGSNEWLLMTRGHVHLKLRKVKNGQADCDQAIRLKSDMPEAYHCRALAAAYAGDAKGAMKDLGFAVKLDPEFIPAYETRAGMNQGKGNLQPALDDYNVLVRLKPMDGVVLWRRGNLNLAMGNAEQAIKDFDAAVKLAPDNSNILVDRARLHERNGQLEKALEDYTATLKLAPGQAEVYLNRGMLYVRLNKKDLAKADFDKAVSLNASYGEIVAKLNDPAPLAAPATAASNTPAAPKPVEKPDPAKTAALVPQSEAEAAKPTVKQPEVKKTFIAGASAPAPKQSAPTTPAPATPAPETKAPEVAPEPAKVAEAAPAQPDPDAELKSALSDGTQFERAKNPAKAIEAYSKALSIKPDLHITLMDRGRLYLDQKQWKLALADYEKAAKLSPKDPKAHLGTCRAHVNLNAYKDAIQSCSKVLELDRSPDARVLRGQSYIGLREYDKAIEDLKISTEIRMDAPETFFQLGELYRETGNLLMALNAFTRAIQQKPGYAEAYKARAAIRQSLGDSVGFQEDSTRAAARR